MTSEDKAKLIREYLLKRGFDVPESTLNEALVSAVTSRDEDDDDPDDPAVLPDGTRFADPGGISALRAGARAYPCPTCEEPNKLSIADVQLGYRCDDCADRAEGRERAW